MKSLVLGVAGLAAFTGFSPSCVLGQERAEHAQACQIPGVEAPVECATLKVPENRGRRQSRTIDLHVVIARALQRNAAHTDPVFLLTGGPGTAATAAVAGTLRAFPALRQRRDVVFVDQRGTGRSNPLRCASADQSVLRFLMPIFDLAEIARCRTELDRIADLSAYTTVDAVDDLDEVRAALGYNEINLFGTSYGTRVALVYARRYGSQLRALVLQGVAPPAYRLPLPYARGLDRALDGAIAACAQERACAERFPELPTTVETAFDSLRHQPAPLTLKSPTSGEVFLTYGEAAETIRYVLYSPERTRELPRMLSRAAAGDWRNDPPLATRSPCAGCGQLCDVASVRSVRV